MAWVLSIHIRTPTLMGTRTQRLTIRRTLTTRPMLILTLVMGLASATTVIRTIVVILTVVTMAAMATVAVITTGAATAIMEVIAAVTAIGVVMSVLAALLGVPVATRLDLAVLLEEALAVAVKNCLL